MSSVEYTVAPRAVDVLPSRAMRRLTRRDGLLPLVFTLELMTGIAFGLAAHSGAGGAVVPAKLSFAPSVQVQVPVPATTATALATPFVRRHAPRNPFGALVVAASAS